MNAPRRLTGMAATIAYGNSLRDDPQRLEDIKNHGETVYLYNKNSPSVKLRRERHKAEFLVVMRFVHRIPQTMADAEVYTQCFHPDQVIRNVQSYINYIATSKFHHGRLEDKMKVSSLRERVDSLHWFAMWEAGSKAGPLSGSKISDLSIIWRREISATIHMNASAEKFGTASYSKAWFGIPELRLLFNVVVNRSRCVDWYKQHYVAWALSFMTGVRPGSLAVTAGYENSTEVQALLWEDIDFNRSTEGPGVFLRVRIRWLKGRRDPYAVTGRLQGVEFLLKPCSAPENLVVDCTWLLTMLALERGLFGGQTYDELMVSPRSRLVQNPTIAKRPVFAALKGSNNPEMDFDKAMKAGAFNLPLQQACKVAGLATRATMYVFRREFITTVGRSVGVEEARSMATHLPSRRDSYCYYDYGIGDLDATSILTGEASWVSDLAKARHADRQRAASAAINKRADYPYEERSTYIDQCLGEDDTITGFEDALSYILAKISAAFAFDVTYSVQGTLSKLSMLASSTDTWTWPTGTDKTNPAVWQDLVGTVCHRGLAPRAAAFLRAFMTTRKVARRFVMASATKKFDARWLASVETPSLAQVRDRQAEARALPVGVDIPALTTHSPAVPNTLAGRDSPPDTYLEEEEELDLEASGLAEWNGQEVGDEELVDLEDDHVDEIDSRLVDPLQLAISCSQGGTARIETTMPGEQLESDAGVSEDNQTESTDLVTEQMILDTVREQLRALWSDCTEVFRGRQDCIVCDNIYHDQITPSFQAQTNSISHSNAHRYGRHIHGVIHDPEHYEFHLWANRRAKVGSRWHCPFPTCNFKGPRVNGLQQHVQQSHAAFYERLTHASLGR